MNVLISLPEPQKDVRCELEEDKRSPLWFLLLNHIHRQAPTSLSTNKHPVRFNKQTSAGLLMSPLMSCFLQLRQASHFFQRLFPTSTEQRLHSKAGGWKTRAASALFSCLPLRCISGTLAEEGALTCFSKAKRMRVIWTLQEPELL